ncbi:MAG: alanine--tRNA ligase [Synergistaceae bacterium]|jgi:alanyl-tRNA synthetase|nr:alanine--tRNA ligase [Synergistaceae bacterium]
MVFPVSNKPIKWRSAGELRGLFLSYFEGLGAKRYPSFPLVPDDPTLLFTVAGMVPFKPYFLGLRTPEVGRATTSQKCIRTNDIENVGRTARHHTFFEMLGNFSFGDYFKKEVIPWAWEFLTERVGLDADRLYATIYLDDDEAHDMWKSLVGLPDDRIYRLGEDDNFWAAGPTGPCGPCSEIIYDQGPEFSCGRPDCGVGCSCDRYLEIWNLVFMQYSRDESGQLTPLPKKNIDTGMGLERLSSVVQGVKGDFETDLFKPIIDAASRIACVRYGEDKANDLAVRVISDHLRASAFMIADGILPSNEGPGYVLRRLIRRSARFGRSMGIDRPFLLELLPVVNEIMSDPYTELVEQRQAIEQIILTEEERFGRTLSQGIDLLDDELALARKAGSGKLSGGVAFMLYDTYGFPLELTEEISTEAGVSVDRGEFDSCMERQRERARASSKQSSAVMEKNVYTEAADRLGATKFDGYEVTSEDATVAAIIKDGVETASIRSGTEALVILSQTPFYAERGGQVGDRGVLRSAASRFEVADTIHPSGDLVAHRGTLVEGEMSVGMKIGAFVDEERRNAVRKHHTATHLLHEALGRVLGKHVRQAGSMVTPAFLRFDFNHFAPMTQEEIAEVERIVYSEVLAAKPVTTSVMSYAESRGTGVKALFEEKYGDVVRVVEVPGFSKELCGGIHVSNTGEIGLVRIVRDEGIGSGVRRINAVAGMVSLELFQGSSAALRNLYEVIGGDQDTVVQKAQDLVEERKTLERKNQEAMLRAMLDNVGRLIINSVRIDGTVLIAETLGKVSRDLLRQLGDRIKSAEKSVVMLFGAIEEDGQAALTCMASDEAVKRGVHAGNIVKEIAGAMGGSGGGKPAMGQGGSKDAGKLKEIMASAEGIVRRQLGK